VRLTGTVGAYMWEDGFTAAEVAGALAQIGRDQDVTVIINSGGGVATEGTAIHAILAAHKGRVTGRVEGVAASAASLAILGADEVEMAPGATFMIHEASTVAWGVAEELRQAFEMLDCVSASYAAVYAEETGQDGDVIRQWMRAETWMTAQQAVDNGFADRVGAPPGAPVEVAAFAYDVYARVPADLRAVARARGWTPQTARGQSSPPLPSPAPSPAPAQPPTLAPALDAAAIADACAAAGRPAMAAQLIREGLGLDQARARLDMTAGIEKAVADARRLNPAALPADYAATLMRQGLTLVQAQARCLELVTAQAGPEIDNAPPETADHRAGWAKAVARLPAAKQGGGQGQAASGWSGAVAKLSRPPAASAG
jgi:ATP-dependent Clp protease, protease subunit